MTSRTVPFLVIVLILIGLSHALAAPSQSGIEIIPDDNAQFTFHDDFQTPRFLTQGFLQNLSADDWTPGNIVNTGPNRHRLLIYRFYAPHPIADIDLTIKQVASAGNFGAVNSLYLSSNGLDWQLVASSSDLPEDRNRWQAGPLTVTADKAHPFLGQTELWVKLDMNNYSGVKTGVSNRIQDINLTLTLDPAALAADEINPPASAASDAVWTQALQANNQQILLLDSGTVTPTGPLCYFEDYDSYLAPFNEIPQTYLNPLTDKGFVLQRHLTPPQRMPLSLTAFVALPDIPQGPLALKLTVNAHAQASRQLQVYWNGTMLGQCDTASFFEQPRTFTFTLPAAAVFNPAPLRLAPADQRPVTITSIALTGAPNLQWAPKPILPPKNLDIISSYYLPDPAPPANSQTVEGTFNKQMLSPVFAELQNMHLSHSEFGAIRMTVYNPSSTPARILNVKLNNRSIQDHYVDFVNSPWDDRGVVWYRVMPATVPPKKTSELYIRFRKRPTGDHAEITIQTAQGQQLTQTVPYQAPPSVIDYVTTDPLRRILYVYVRQSHPKTPAPLQALALDHQPLNNVAWYGADFQSQLALAVVTLPAPLSPMSRHTVSVTDTAGYNVAAPFRVLTHFFPKSSIHAPSSKLNDYHMNLNTWNKRSLEECQQYDVYCSSGYPDVVDLHQRVLYCFGPDEPDAHDNRGNGYEKGLGYHARLLAATGWQELIDRYSPHVATWLIMNGTTRPLNWFVYAQVADISCFDPYPVTYYGCDHAYVRESLQLARLAGRPKPMYACLETYGWRQGQGVPSDARGITPKEYRQNVIQAIGCGMKGLTSWVYPARFGGWEGREDFTAEVTAMNKLLAQIEDELLLATPVNWASSDAGTVMTGRVEKDLGKKQRVWVGALLSGPDKIIITPVNHIPASKPQLPDITPARDVTITIDLPDYITSLQAQEILPDRRVDIPCRVQNQKAVITLDQLETGRVFLLSQP